MGLGAIACGARRVTDEMFLAAARSLASQVTDADLAQGSIYPALSRIREVSAKIGAAVAKVAWEQGHARGTQPRNLLAQVRETMFDPRY